jgi:hypothetical protein
MKRRVITACAAIAAALAAPCSLVSQTIEVAPVEPPAPTADSQPIAEAAPADALPMPLSITTSGGVSLGGYQAGFLYYLTEVVKLNPGVFTPRILTGSSAGMINSVIAAISLGSPPENDPQHSPFFESWTELRYDELLDVDDAPPLALSSREAMKRITRRLERIWEAGLDPSLDVVIGGSATRVIGRTVGVGKGFDVPRQEEKFVFRVRGRGRGQRPLVTNYVDQTWGIEQPLLPFAERDRTDAAAAAADFAVIEQVMFASSAFPLAFAPQEVGFCMTSPDMVDPTDLAAFRDCPEPRYKIEFIDGSMFDRNPVGLAHRTAKAGLVRGEGPAPATSFREAPDMRLGTVPRNVLFVYLDAQHTSYPEKAEERATDNIEALFPAFGAYSQNYVRAAQAKELYTLVDEDPEIRKQLEITFRDLPSASGLLFNFFGFFDRQFRVFDFYLGMHDARRHVLASLAPQAKKAAGHEVPIALPEESSARRGAESWAPFFCLRDAVDGDAAYQGACLARGLEEFRILLQVSLDRLYDRCRGLEQDETLDNLHCKQAMAGEPPPRVHGPNPDDPDFWKSRPDETNFQYNLRLLEEYDFWFRDLGLDRDESWMAMSMIRERLAGLLDTFVKKLPYRERSILRTIGKPALNFFAYQPPQAIIYLAGGTGLEVGTSLTSRFVPTRWLRFNLALQMRGLTQLLTPAKNVWTLTPLFGVELEIPQLGGAALQARLGARVGYQFSTGDRMLGRACNFGDFGGDTALCSAPMGQAFAVFSFYERIRVEGGVEWFPYFLPPMSDRDRNYWSGFIVVGWQWISPF